MYKGHIYIQSSVATNKETTQYKINQIKSSIMECQPNPLIDESHPNYVYLQLILFHTLPQAGE